MAVKKGSILEEEEPRCCLEHGHCRNGQGFFVTGAGIGCSGDAGAGVAGAAPAGAELCVRGAVFGALNDLSSTDVGALPLLA